MVLSRSRHVVAGALLAAVGLGVAGCWSDAAGSPDPVHIPGATSSSDPTEPASTSDGSGAPSDAVVTTGPVRVDVQLRVPKSAATEAFASYVEEHARSVIGGSPTPGLRDVTSPAEYDRQVQVVNDARDRGLVVPTRPQVAVVAARSTDDGETELGVCLYLPSTEFVDKITGVSPAGQVPDTWAPAVATVAKETLTPVVDKLGQPGTTFAPDCGGLS